MRTLPARYQPSGPTVHGGMSSVAFCMDKVLERPVAVKFLQATTHRRRMDDELAALLKMRSKHVVQIYDLCKFSDNYIGIIQEFIDGKDLFESFAPPNGIDGYYRQLWQIASGISDIHAVDVIHRDIKPNNVKIDPEGVIKIFDFGLARDAGPAAATVGFVGTPGFAAPELYATAAKFTSAIDVYAFGATSLFMATGDLTPELKAIPPAPLPTGYFGAIRIPTGKNGTALSAEVVRLLDACLAKNPNDRPAITEVRDALARHLLFDRHQALVVFRGSPSYLNAANRAIALRFGTVGSVDIAYDGLKFAVTAASGEVYINNRPVATGYQLPGCCVVALGSPARRNNERVFITFDVSHPEIVV
ncbi:MAG: serine/threonine protein kinase [Zoogloeaceae bacterium]|nr:serine/threonine protein kinase [Zoogloeaceae bacterium]